jgi:hypothetical protein
VEKHGTARQARDVTILRRMRFACWITRLQTHTQHIKYLLVFHSNNGYAKALQSHVYTHVAVSFFMLLIYVNFSYFITRSASSSFLMNPHADGTLHDDE